MPVKVYDDNQSIHDIGSVIMGYQPFQNAFVNALVNRIAMVIVTSREWDDPWAIFDRGTLQVGETVEEIFVNIAKPHSYDPAVAEKEWMKREIPDVRAAFHTLNYQKFYKATVEEQELGLAFVSWSGVSDLIARIVSSLYTGMNYDNYIVRKYMLCREILNGGMEMVSFNNSDSSDLVQQARSMSSKFAFLKKSFNRAGVYNAVDRDRQYIIIDADREAELDVDVLAKAFNMERTEFLGHLKIVDSFTEHDLDRLALLFANDDSYTPFTAQEITNLGLVGAVLMDRDWWMIFTYLRTMREDNNGQGLYWQYWLHNWKIISVSPFHNAAAFVSSAGTVGSVSISPATATLSPGATMVFTATVTGTGIFEKNVVFSVTGGTSAETRIDPSNGTLHVGTDETAETLTVKVTSQANATKTATATVTVSA